MRAFATSQGRRGAATGRTAVTIGVPAAIGLGLGVLGLGEAVTRAAIAGTDAESALVLVLLALGTTLPIAFLGATGAAVTVGGVAVLSLTGFGTLTGAGLAGVLVALYQLVSSSARPVEARFLPAGLAVTFVVLAALGHRPASSEAAALTLALAVLVPAAILGGMAAGLRDEARRNRAAHDLVAETLVDHAARGERARIARELHDIVAHHISMVAIQAESARLTVPGLPEAAAGRLSAIGDTARTALAEMRGLLGVLREDVQLEAAERSPLPGLGELTALVDESREATGSSTRFILRGTPTAVDPNVGLVTYRVVQEALTNARRHAPGAGVDVELSYTDSSLRLRIRDNGPGPGPSQPNTGHGVVGMRERAAAAGGFLFTGPAPGGGFLVEAVLPVRAEATP